MDALSTFLTGRKLQVVLRRTSCFHLFYLVAPLLTSGSGSSRDPSEGGSIGVKSVLVILALSQLAPNRWLWVEATVHKVYMVAVGWACVRSFGLQTGVSSLLMRNSMIEGAVLEFTLVKMGTVAVSSSSTV